MNSTYRVELSPSALKHLSRLDRPTRDNIVRRIRQLTINPFAGDIKPLKGTKNTYRCRIGGFRIIYTVDKVISFIAITAILPRGDAYK